MRRIVVFFVLCIAFMVSCSPAKHLSINNVTLSEFRMESSTKASVTFAVSAQNQAQYPISLAYMDATVKKDLELFATVALKDTVVVDPAAGGVVLVPVEVTLCDPMSLLSMGLNIRSWDLDDFVVDGKMVFLGKNSVKKVYKAKGTQLSTLLTRLKR